MHRDPWVKTLIVLLVAIAAWNLAGLVWTLMIQFADIILLLVFAWLLASALEPVTYYLEARIRIQRAGGAAIVYLGLLIVLSLATLWIIPVVALQVSQIGTNLPTYVANTGTWLVALQGWLSERGVVVDAAALLDYKEAARRVESMGPVIVNNALALATGVASVLFSLIIVLMLSFYLMLDGPKFASGLVETLPADRRDDLNYLFYSTHRAFGGYVRGQLIQAVVYGVGTALVMMAAELSYTAVASIFAFAIMLIPFVGPILAIVPPVMISVFVHPDRAWWVFLLLLLLQQVVFNVLAPKVMSQSVGMHPLLVLLALLMGAKLAGMWGAIFAIPVAAVIVAMVGFYRMTVDERRVHLEERVGGEVNRHPEPVAGDHRPQIE